jgi:hypothetical protein
MKTVIGIFGIFTSTVLFLAIEINGEPIFSHIYEVISPATQATQKATEDFFDRSMNKTQRYSRKLFDNSVPKVNDAIKSKMSGVKKSVQEPAEKITDSEKAELDELIKSHR